MPSGTSILSPARLFFHSRVFVGGLFAGRSPRFFRRRADCAAALKILICRILLARRRAGASLAA